MNRVKDLKEAKKLDSVGNADGDTDENVYLDNRRATIRKAMKEDKDQRLEEKNYYFNDFFRFVPNE